MTLLHYLCKLFTSHLTKSVYTSLIHYVRALVCFLKEHESPSHNKRLSPYLREIIMPIIICKYVAYPLYKIVLMIVTS